MAKQALILVYPKESGSLWQSEQVREVFELFFECREIPCQQRSGAGLLRRLLGTARGEETSRCRQVIGSRAQPDEPPPHIVAYGVGAYHVGQALLPQSESVHVGRVALIGCPLHRRFPWKAIVAQQPSAFSVRNELVRPGQLPRVAVWLAWWKNGRGNAGLHGFRGPDGLVHTAPMDADPLGPCGQCQYPVQEPFARVDNAPLGDYTRDAFLGLWHALMLWLPFLWDLDADDLWSFVDYCKNCAREESLFDGAERKVRVVEESLAERPWRFLARLYPLQPAAARKDLQTVLANRFLKRNHFAIHSHLGPVTVSSHGGSRQFRDRHDQVLPEPYADLLEEQVGRALRSLRQGVVAAYRQLFARLMDHFDMQLLDPYWQEDVQRYRTSGEWKVATAGQAIGFLHPGTAITAAVSSVANLA